MTEILELRIGEVVVTGGLAISLSATRRDGATVIIGKPIFDREEVRRTAERHRKRLDKGDKQGYDDSNPRPAS